MSDQTALSFASRSAPADGVVVVFAEEGPKLTPSAQDLDKKSKGLLSRAVEITGFKGKKDSIVDLLAPQGLKSVRLVLAGTDKTASYGPEDWLNLGGSVRGLLTGKEGPTAHVFLETAQGEIAAADVASFALGALLRGYKFKKYKTKARKKNGAAGETNDRTLKKIVIHCADPKAAGQAFAASARHRRRRHACARSRQRAGQRARAGRVCGPCQAAHQARRPGRGSRTRKRCRSSA